jgi:hypothetical protein
MHDVSNLASGIIPAETTKHKQPCKNGYVHVCQRQGLFKNGYVHVCQRQGLF